MKEAIYRLGEYKVIKPDTGQLIWEAHFGFCEFQTGHCFRKGSILFIGPAENRRSGFLKGEFLDDLKKYPEWANTKYYCIGVDVYHCKNGKRITREEMLLWTIGRNQNSGIKNQPDVPNSYSIGACAANGTENVAFRLQRFEIIAKSDGQIISKTYSGANSVSSGNCFILENILFIGPTQNRPFILNKRQFLAHLSKLPRWDLTDYFCKRSYLHECNPIRRMQGERKKTPPMGSTTKNQDGESAHKNSPEDKFPSGAYRASFSKRLSAISGTFVDFLKNLGRAGHFLHYRFVKSYPPKSIAISREYGIRITKRITSTITLVFLIIAALLAFMLGLLKKLCDKWQGKNNKPASEYDEDH